MRCETTEGEYEAITNVGLSVVVCSVHGFMHINDAGVVALTDYDDDKGNHYDGICSQSLYDLQGRPDCTRAADTQAGR